MAAQRNWYVDFLRVLALGMVVFGHWLVTSITVRNGLLQGDDALATIHWGAWVTLGFQVMPLFFLAGGYANAASWASHQRVTHQGTGESWPPWLAARAWRLLWPTSLYLAAAVMGVIVTKLAGVDPKILVPAAWAMTLHLWFLPVYFILVALGPLLCAADKRWGLLVPVATVLAAAGVDAVVLNLHFHLIGWLNYPLVWGTSFYLGIMWRHGRLGGLRPIQLAVAGATVYALLLAFGPYPVSLIGITGERIDNTAPPSMALLAFSLAEVGIVIALQSPVARWLQRPRRLVRLIQANGVVMTVYLWHMVPVVLVAPVLYGTGLIVEPAIGSAAWWIHRVAWLAVLLAVFIPIVMLVGRWENPPGAWRVDRTDATTKALLLAGLTLMGFALGRFAVGGLDAGRQIPYAALAAYVTGGLLFLGSGREQMRPQTPPAGPRLLARGRHA
jgi:hypothetical protein